MIVHIALCAVLASVQAVPPPQALPPQASHPKVVLPAPACSNYTHGDKVNCAFFARDAMEQLEKTYWPNFVDLLLKEGDDKYPMPASSKVHDLLEGLKGVPGIAVHTSPDVTVTEGQGYAMLSAGMRKDVDVLKGLTVGWQANGQGFPDTAPCGGCGASGEAHFDPRQVCTGAEKTPCLCKTVKGAYMPGWNMPYLTLGAMGSATDGDEDAVAGLIYLAELTGTLEFREYAVRSITAFVLEDLGFAEPSANSRQVPVAGDIPKKLQTMYLWRGGTCWGGYDKSDTVSPENRNLCINPAYFSPGEWRLFRRYLEHHADLVPAPHKAQDLMDVLDSAITWGYNLLQRISCDSGLVSNWWTLPDHGWPWHGELKCANSGTQAGAYYSDAARIPWRVVLDYVWFGAEATAPFYDSQGRQKGTWGAREYAQRWASSWQHLIAHEFPAGAFPPFKEGVTPLRKDQVLPLLSKSKSCAACPHGFTASPWNGWGGYPVVSTFQVPLDDLDSETMQQWVDYLAKVGFEGCQNKQYFDLGQEIVVGAMLGGAAWLPLPDIEPKETKASPTEPPAANTSLMTELAVPKPQSTTIPVLEATTTTAPPSAAAQITAAVHLLMGAFQSRSPVAPVSASFKSRPLPEVTIVALVTVPATAVCAIAAGMLAGGRSPRNVRATSRGREVSPSVNEPLYGQLQGSRRLE